MLDYQRLIYPQMSARPWMNQSHLVMKFELASIRNRVSSNISKPFLNEERVLRVFGGSHSFFTGIPLGNGTCCSWVVGFSVNHILILAIIPKAWESSAYSKVSVSGCPSSLRVKTSWCWGSWKRSTSRPLLSAYDWVYMGRLWRWWHDSDDEDDEDEDEDRAGDHEEVTVVPIA